MTTPVHVAARLHPYVDIMVLIGAILPAFHGFAATNLREENFDREPTNWEAINNRNHHFSPRPIIQDFGYSAESTPIGPSRGGVGGKINPAADPAYYAYRLPREHSFDTPMTASGKLLVKPGPGHFLLGFFNASTLNEWRTPNTIVIRINGRGESFHCHLEYCTARWRAGAGVIGELVPGERIDAKNLPSGQVYDWRLSYQPDGPETGLITLEFAGLKATCIVDKAHRTDSASFTHFGLLPVLKSWDDPGEAWINQVIINEKAFDFSTDPGWDGFQNRRSYETKNTRPRFDFGWSPTHFAGGKSKGELGGLIFRGDCREPARLAAYGDRIGPLTLDTKLFARGKLSVLRAVSDSTASIGFYNAKESLRVNPSQAHAIPMDYLGINIEGPSSEGFYFYPVYRVHGDSAKAFQRGEGSALQIHPDRKVHEWSLQYDPAGANGLGQIIVELDGKTCTLNLNEGDKKTGAKFDRFGICTPWIDGNSVTAYFDDLQYTHRTSAN